MDEALRDTDSSLSDADIFVMVGTPIYSETNQLNIHDIRKRAHDQSTKTQWTQLVMGSNSESNELLKEELFDVYLDYLYDTTDDQYEPLFNSPLKDILDMRVHVCHQEADMSTKTKIEQHGDLFITSRIQNDDGMFVF